MPPDHNQTPPPVSPHNLTPELPPLDQEVARAADRYRTLQAARQKIENRWGELDSQSRAVQLSPPAAAKAKETLRHLQEEWRRLKAEQDALVLDQLERGDIGESLREDEKGNPPA